MFYFRPQKSKHCHISGTLFLNQTPKSTSCPIVAFDSRKWNEHHTNTLPEMLSLKFPKYNTEIKKESPAVTSPFPGHHQTCTLARQGSLSSFCQLFLRYGMNSSFFRNACNSYPLITPSSSSETLAVFIG